MPETAMIAMSGGVDSSVAALLMQQQGYSCVGTTLKLFRSEEVGADSRTCCSLSDVMDARSVCLRLGIRHYVFNFSDDFRREVIDRFVGSYLSGGTPNPCIDCNCYIKFGKLFRRLDEMEIVRLATGHYARIKQDGSGRWLLQTAADPSKDQTYMLYTMTQQQLARSCFPLGELHKTQVREIAQEHGFANARKRDSQDICFVPNGDYASFIERTTGRPALPGRFVTPDGQAVGQHNGIIRYTIGQRKHLGIALGQPVYVCAKSTLENTVTVGAQSNLYASVVTAHNINLIVADSLEHPVRVRAKLRYRQQAQPATVRQTDADTLLITFDMPQRAPAPGQAVVLYDGETVVGGGVIADAT